MDSGGRHLETAKRLSSREVIKETLLEIIRNAQNLAENLAINLRGGQTHLLSPQRSGD